MDIQVSNSFNKLKQQENSFFIIDKIPFVPEHIFNPKTVERIFNFAYDMSFGIGEHRATRSGGKKVRENGEIFANAFQGKLAECAVFNTFKKAGVKMDLPDFAVHQKGIWDNSDFTIRGKIISVKSTKEKGNLLLLETEDWDKEGKYIPDKNDRNKNYGRNDFFILVRLSPDCEKIVKSEELFYSNEISDKKLNNLKKMIFENSWKYDIPGYITHQDLVYIINDKHIIPKDALLNGATKMDAENYYIQSGNMRDISDLTTEIGNIEIIETEKISVPVIERKIVSRNVPVVQQKKVEIIEQDTERIQNPWQI